jgi:serine/threonine protein kinase
VPVRPRFVHRASPTAGETPVQLGDFRIVREGGRGSMGVVSEAERLSLRRRVALKVLRFAGTADAEALKRFQREAETVGRLHHTNIVPIFAVGCEQGVQYYAMQFIDGRGLDAVLAEAGQPLDPREVARLGMQAGEALAHAHARGIIHRDLPSRFGPAVLVGEQQGPVDGTEGCRQSIPRRGKSEPAAQDWVPVHGPPPIGTLLLQPAGQLRGG